MSDPLQTGGWRDRIRRFFASPKTRDQSPSDKARSRFFPAGSGDTRLLDFLHSEPVKGGSQDPERTVRQMEELLDAGADIEGCSMLGVTPLEAAILLHLHPRILETLINRGANLEPQGRSLLFNAFPSNREDLILLLLKHGANPNVRGGYFSTPLHFAAMRDWAEACAALLDRGAVLDARCERGFTPVYLATICHCPRVVQLLRQRGAPVDFKPAEVDRYPMAMAARWAALSNGYPAFVTGVAVDNSLSGLDADTGLPMAPAAAIVESAADWVVTKAQWAAVRRYSRLHGPPWNSRLPWIDVFRTPDVIFQDAADRGKVVTLTMNGPCTESPDGKATVALRNRRFDLEAEEHLVVTSSDLFPYEFDSIDARYEAALRQRKPIADVLPTSRGDRTEISLGWCPDIEEVSLCWKPKGSPLALIRFPEKHARGLAGRFRILDLELGTLSWARVSPKLDLRFQGGLIPPRQTSFTSHQGPRPRSGHRPKIPEHRRGDGVLRRVQEKSCPPSAPIVLRFNLGGMHAPQPSSIEWDDSLMMLCCPSGVGRKPGRRPSEAEWQAFWKTCEGFRVWSWSEDELASQVRGGPTVFLVFQTEERFVSASSWFHDDPNLMRKVQLIHKTLTKMTLNRAPTSEGWFRRA